MVNAYRRPTTMLRIFVACSLFLAVNALTAETEDFAWVEQRVRELQPKASEKRFDEIGWADDIRDAMRLAKENQRAVFLFTHDGRMNIGRC